MLITQLGDNLFSNDRKYLISEYLQFFLVDAFDQEMAVRWLEKGYIHTGGIACGTPEVKLLNSTKALEIQVLKAVFKVPSMIVTPERKQFLLERILGEQHNDIAEKTRYYLNASLPDAAMKEIAWKDMTSKDSKLPLKKREAYLEGFMDFYQQDVLAPYKDKFLKEIHEQYHYQPQKYFVKFFEKLLPRHWEVNDDDIEKMREIKNSNDHLEFKNKMQEGIELMQRSKWLRK